MNAKRFFLSAGLLAGLLAGLFAALPGPAVQAVAPVECRFGITVPAWPSLNIPNKFVDSYDLPPLGIGYYLDWRSQRSPAVPGSIKFLHDLSIKDPYYTSLLAQLPTLVENNPGAIWVVGNEPDDRTGQQDTNTAETYAERFWAMAKVIRAADPTAKITFGTIIMPTTLRVMYLQRAWNRLVALTGSAAAASALIDIWSPHGFLLNEELPTPANPRPWGSGIPLGFDNLAPQYQEIIGITQMNDVELFKTRMTRFRQFLKDIGEQNKPVWLTEWGVLAPSQNPPNATIKYYTLPETVTAQFFVDTVNWMETTTDPALGMPGDENRLVQKWFWFSLNDPLYHFGGTLVDPFTLKTTTVGHIFSNYEPPAGAEPVLNPDLEPAAFKVRPLARHDPGGVEVDYQLELRLRNNIVHNHLNEAVYSIYDNDILVSSGPVKVGRCGGDGLVILEPIPFTPGNHTFRVVIESAAEADINLANNEKSYQLDLGFPFEVFAPIIQK